LLSPPTAARSRQAHWRARTGSPNTTSLSASRKRSAKPPNTRAARSWN